jgi:glycosyltransferase involved in cell wall biosynthesis
MEPIEVTVLMPIYNGEKFLQNALDSVLMQQLVKFELLALNDGSKDDSLKILQSNKDSRLRLVSHSNCGLSSTLNKGIDLVKTPYIARQDQDDLMLPNRLVRQLDFLKRNPNVGMVGTWAQIFVGKNATDRFHRHPLYPDTLRLKLLFDNPFVHSSVMIRTEVLKKVGAYSEDKLRQPPEDFELWSRISRVVDIANLPEVLTVYREMPNSMSRTKNNPFLPKVLKISAENIHMLLQPDFDENACSSLAALYHGLPASVGSLSKRQVSLMLDALIARISKGGSTSHEFRTEVSRLRSHFNFRLARRWIPGPLLDTVRPLVKLIRRK